MITNSPNPVVIAAPDAGGTGSVASVVRNHARELAKGREVLLVSSTLPETSIPGVTGVRIQSPTFAWLRRLGHVPRELAQAWKIGVAVRRLCIERKVSALFVHSQALGTLVGRRIQREFGIPCLLVVHADIHDKPPKTYDARVTAFYRWVTPLAYRHADRILAISSFIARAAIRHGADPSRVHIVPNGIEVAEIAGQGPVETLVPTPAALVPEEDAPLRLLYVGRLSPEKGVADLLQACALLARRSVPFWLGIIGDGPLRLSLEEKTRDLGITDAVDFLGQQPRERLWGYYGSADVVCVPSLSEAQGLVVLEALISGTPVVASEVGGIPDMVHDGENGRLHPPGSPEKLANLLAGLSVDRIMLAHLAKNAYPSVADAYSWNAIGRQLGSLLDEVDQFHSMGNKKRLTMNISQPKCDGMSQEYIEILCSTDVNFIPYCAAMIESLLSSAELASYRIHVLHDDVQGQEIARLGAFFSGSAQFNSYLIRDEDIASIPMVDNGFPKAAYYRLFFQRYLPADVEKILYLDGDIFVNDDLTDIWAIDITGHVLAAVPVEYINQKHLLDLRLLGRPYFNSGVMLINVVEWKNRSIGERVLEWINAHPELAVYPDQDGLNVVLANNWVRVPSRFNVTTNLLEIFNFNVNGFINARGKPSIIHFTGRLKPWNYLSRHPFKHVYLRCLRRTPWPSAACVDFSAANFLRKFIPSNLLHVFPARIRQRALLYLRKSF